MHRSHATGTASRTTATILLIAGLCGLSGCVERNPSWDAPADASTDAATVAGSASLDASADPSADGTDTGTSSVGPSPGETTTIELAESSTSSSDDTGGPISRCEAELPAEGECPDACSSCDDGVCTLACEGKRACDATTIACPEGWPCRIHCIGEQACGGARLACPSAHACEIVCDGDGSCQKAKMACGDGPCSLQCDGHARACRNTEFRCGGGAGEVSCGVAQGIAPILVADPESSCTCILNAC